MIDKRLNLIHSAAQAGRDSRDMHWQSISLRSIVVHGQDLIRCWWYSVTTRMYNDVKGVLRAQIRFVH